MAASKSRKSAKKSKKRTKRQSVSFTPNTVQALEKLIGSVLELNQWQNYLLQEAKSSLKDLAKIQEKAPKKTSN
ncbi:MAG: hypothetical protein AMJ79_07645 [Phycisphaerae bacterium SM23_30]|nr:MAG: hypothetical protein AMJ79_07645 [Phycisphaerae bacterium SM23_30]